MNQIKLRISRMFGGMTAALFRYRVLTILIMAVALAGLFTNLRYVVSDPSTEGFFHKDAATLIAYNEFREQFGRDERILVAINPPEIFDLIFLQKLKGYHEALENEVPHLNDVTSLINARKTLGREDELVVKELLEDWPRNETELAALKQYVLGQETYRNMLVSADGRFTTIVVATNTYSDAGDGGEPLEGFEDEPSAAMPMQGDASDGVDGGGAAQSGNGRTLLTDAENQAVIAGIETVNARFRGPDFPLYFAGSPVVTDTLKREMTRNMQRFLGMAGLIIGLFLFVLFRRVTGVVYPLIIVLLSLVATISVMGMMGEPLKTPTMILPSFLLSVGVGAAVHILAIFFHNFNENGDKQAAMIYAMEHSGLPVVMTALTTAAGLMSFATAEVASLGALGVYASVGVLIAMVLTMILLPALIALTPMRPKPRPEGKQAPVMDRILAGFATWSIRHHGMILAGSLALTIVAIIGVTRIDFSHDPLRWFPETMDVRISSDKIDTALGGSISADFLVDTGKENGLYEVDVMRSVDAFGAYAEQYQSANGHFKVGKTFSLATILKEINQALNENRPEEYKIPDNRELIAQEFLLFENTGSDDLSDVVDSQFQVARINVRLPWRDVSTLVGGLDHLKAKAEEMFQGKADVQVTGLLVLLATSLHSMMTSTVTSYTIAASVITLFMILMLGSFKLGLLSMIPNLMPILYMLGFMGWAGIHLDMFTLLIGSIAMGLAVDDTIHFMHNYAGYRSDGTASPLALNKTMLSTGRAMLITSIVLVGGFWVFMFATLTNLFLFGLLTGTTLALTLLANFVVAPALLTVLDRFEKSGGRK